MGTFDALATSSTSMPDTKCCINCGGDVICGTLEVIEWPDGTHQAVIDRWQDMHGNKITALCDAPPAYGAPLVAWFPQSSRVPNGFGIVIGACFFLLLWHGLPRMEKVAGSSKSMETTANVDQALRF